MILVFRLPTNRSLLSNLALVVNLGNELGFLAVAQDGAIRFWLNLDSEDFSQASVPLNVGSFVTHLVDCKVCYFSSILRMVCFFLNAFNNLKRKQELFFVHLTDLFTEFLFVVVFFLTSLLNVSKIHKEERFFKVWEK